MRKEKEPVVFTYTTMLDAPIEDVWFFFSDVHNLSKLTSFPKVTVLHKEKEIVHLNLSFFIVRLRWILKIDDIIELESFRDFGLRTPFPIKSWEHEHRFVKKMGKTKMVDTVHCHVRFPSLLVKFMLKMMFKSRERKMKAYFQREK